MPELPEVETIRRGLAPLCGRRVRAAWSSGMPLRGRVFDPAPMIGARLDTIERRGKVLVWRFDRGALLQRLGMTGYWLLDPPSPPRHLHLRLAFDGATASYADPRRFGALAWTTGDPAGHRWLAALGPEPFDPACTPAYLARALAGRRAAIKPLLMDGRIVAGIGNIYASEICFRAGIDPRRAAGSLTMAELRRLAQAMRTVLAEAIAAGGSTIRDFAGIDGRPGYFAHRFMVYRRAGAPCRVCGEPIVRLHQQQRASYFCPRCQPSG